MKKLLCISLLMAIVGCSDDNKTTPTPTGTGGSGSGNEVAESQEVPISPEVPNIYESFNAVEGSISVNLYMEEGVWVVTKSVISEDGLPDVVEKKVFTTKEKAYAYAKEFFGITEEQKNPDAIDQPAPEEIADINTLVPKQALWEVDPNLEWNWEWEVKFAEWFRDTVTTTFFMDLGIENDCQDIAVQSRMIFARLNKLPVAFRLAGGGA